MNPRNLLFASNEITGSTSNRFNNDGFFFGLVLLWHRGKHQFYKGYLWLPEMEYCLKRTNIISLLKILLLQSVSALSWIWNKACNSWKCTWPAKQTDPNFVENFRKSVLKRKHIDIVQIKSFFQSVYICVLTSSNKSPKQHCKTENQSSKNISYLFCTLLRFQSETSPFTQNQNCLCRQSKKFLWHSKHHLQSIASIYPLVGSIETPCVRPGRSGSPSLVTQAEQKRQLRTYVSVKQLSIEMFLWHEPVWDDSKGRINRAKHWTKSF